MKMHSSFFTPVLLSLFFAMTATVMGWGAAPASAQTTLSASTTTFTSTSSSTTTTTTAAVVQLKGTVTGLPESVAFSGAAKLSASVVTDPDFGTTPVVLLSIDMSGVNGVGSSTGTKYVTADQKIIDRRLAASDAVQYTFPFYPSGGSAMSARVGGATFNVSFDINSLKLTAASGSIGSP